MNPPDKHVQNLIGRFLTKEATDQDLSVLQEWLKQDPTNLQYFDKVNDLFQAEKMLERFDKRKTSEAWRRVVSRIDGELRVDKTKEHPFLAPATLLRVAASVSLLLVALWGVWKFSFEKKSRQSVDNTLVYHSDARNTHLVLPDSTSVWLNANSSIEYATDFSKKREVRLKGEAFFDVKKKHSQNFVVKTKHLLIQVKGTRFNVEAYEENSEKATLEEGEIELTVQGRLQTYSMIPGDQITISKTQQTITRMKVNPTNYTAWKEDKLVFDNALLEEIIQKLESRYHVTIRIDSVIAKRERLSMTIEYEPIEEILEMIQLSSQLNYRIENETITIYE
jgi:transmembrane sensor